jgi:predicted membrane channel-forming protein YqfA (hemolysin III family)
MIDDILTGLLGGYVADRLARRVRPKKTSEFDSVPIDELRLRNNWIEVTGSLIFGGGLFLMLLCMAGIGLNGDVWRLGVFFCFPMTLTLFSVCLAMLPRGIKRFREFWRFHELKHGTRLALLLSMYVPFAAIGLVSAFKVLLSIAST